MKKSMFAAMLPDPSELNTEWRKDKVCGSLHGTGKETTFPVPFPVRSKNHLY